MAQQLSGEVIAIFIGASRGMPLHLVESVRAVPGRGLEGDRYFNGTGTFVKKDKPWDPSMEATLIESEAIEALEREDGIQLEPAATRRNIVTRNLALNHLVGKTFSVGPVRLVGIKLCEPCGHLEGLTLKGVRNGLIHRGGLRCQILSEGVIRIGDPVETAASVVS